jgi:hypothetical protein
VRLEVWRALERATAGLVELRADHPRTLQRDRAITFAGSLEAYIRLDVQHATEDDRRHYVGS